MTKLFTKIKPTSDSTDLDRVRDELDKSSINFSVVDEQIRSFAFLLAIAEEQIAEVALGVLVRKLMKYEQNKVNNEVLWLFLATILSRPNVSLKSTLRISLLGIASRIKDWASPIFALLAIALDRFLQNSLESGEPLIAEQTVDFLATWGENYAKAPRTSEQVAKMNSLARSVLEEVDEPILQEEWSEGLELFFNIARKTKYSDQRIWSSSSELLKRIYPIKALNDSENSENNYRVYNHIFRLITSHLLKTRLLINNSWDDKDFVACIPQCDKPEKMIQTLELIFQGENDSYNIGLNLGSQAKTTKNIRRHGQYSLDALEELRLIQRVKKGRKSELALTDKGVLIAKAPDLETKKRLLIEAMLNYKPVWLVISEVTEGGKPLTDELVKKLVFPPEDQEADTSNRRSQTIKNWVIFISTF